MILVTGATGNVGRHVIGGLVAAGAGVRALTRDPANAHLPARVEVQAGDLTRPETWPAALRAVDRAYVMSIPGELAGFLDAARGAGVRHIVLLSSGTVTLRQPNPIARTHAECERLVERSGLDWTFLRPTAFMANDLRWAPGVRAQGVVRAPYGQAATAAIDERDIAAVAVAALLREGHAGQAYPLTGPASLTQVERVRLLGEALGRTLRFEELDPAAARAHMASVLPPPLVEAVLGMLAAQVGQTAEVVDTVERVTGRAPFSYAAWARLHAADFA